MLRTHQKKIKQNAKKEPHGKNNQKMIQQQLAQLHKQPVRHSVMKTMAAEVGYEWRGSWSDYFKLILLCGGSVSLAGVAFMWASSVRQLTLTTEGSVAAVGSSRPEGNRYYAPITRDSLFQPQAKSAPAAQHLPVEKEPVVRSPVQHPKQETIKVPHSAPQQFSLDAAAAGFNCLHEMVHGRATLLNLYHQIKRFGSGLINSVANIQQIPAPDWVADKVVIKQRVNTYHVKPLHLALISGRYDAFALLLAMGASLDDVFKIEFVREGMRAEQQEILDVKLSSLIYDLPRCHFVGHICTEAMSHEIFLTYLHRKDFKKVSEMLHFKFRSLDSVAHRSGYSVEAYEVERVFSHLPSVSEIRFSLGDLTPGYEEFLFDVHFELAWMKQSAEKRYSLFGRYSPEARQAALPHINAYLDCFTALIKGIDKRLTRKEYDERRVARILSQYQPSQKSIPTQQFKA